MRVAYATAEACGLGHAVRGVALAQAGRRAGIEVRAFGPPRPGVAEPEYEGSADWERRVADFAPDLLLGDVQWLLLERLRKRLEAPAWLLLRWVQSCHCEKLGPWSIDGWERRISIEPAADGLPRITDRIPPIVVDPPHFTPVAGQRLSAGYNTYWESVYYGWRHRVVWLDEPRELDRAARLKAGGEMTENGGDALMRMIS
jgi:hypothetical protein